MTSVSGLDPISHEIQAQAMFRVRKTGRLRIGRISSPGATYFVTTCTAGRNTAFSSADAARIAANALTSLVSANDVAWITGTVMPDHLHALFELGGRLPLERVIAKLKGNIARTTHQSSKRIRWQENVFEHRLRPAEMAESYAFYIYMNPYAAGLCRMHELWPWWVCTDMHRFRFPSLRRQNGCPQPEWLEEAERISNQIVHRLD